MKIELLTLTAAALSTMACASALPEYPTYPAKEAADVSKPVAIEPTTTQKPVTSQEAKAADEELAQLKQHLQTLGEPTPEEQAQMAAEGMGAAKEEAVEPMDQAPEEAPALEAAKPAIEREIPSEESGIKTEEMPSEKPSEM